MVRTRRTRDFVEVIRQVLAADPELATAVEEEAFNADIAQQVYDLRTEANLTQAELAKLINTHQSAISRIEDADYDSHSLTTLKRIARAFNRRLRVHFCAQPFVTEGEVTEYALEWVPAVEWRPQFIDESVRNRSISSLI
jgi:transcriptional regulator with XRE-family HTH domain